MIRTAEHVSDGHPDKFCDQVADHTLDVILSLSDDNEKEKVRTAFECLAKDNLLVISGEMRVPDIIKGRLDIESIARQVWEEVGYGHNGPLTVIDNIKAQSIEIRGAQTGNESNTSSTGTDSFGAGDQGVMVGYATSETKELLPLEYVVARDICLNLKNLRRTGKLEYLRSDCKTQATIDFESNQVPSIIIAAQLIDGDLKVNDEIYSLAVAPVLDKFNLKLSGRLEEIVKINGTGTFTVGGTIGDAGVVGRKIVVDAYGPRVPVGGGAFSGKDFTKVDRSAAYMARHIAKDIVANKIKGAEACTVNLAYGIGQHTSEMVTAITDQGVDLSDYVQEKFGDLSPRFIIDRLGLAKPTGLISAKSDLSFDSEGWRYFQTASFGHFGRENFPWEKVN